MTSGPVDPICAMAVSADTPFTEEFRGQRYYFCSDDCRATFRSDPDGYAKLKTFENQGPSRR